MKINKVIIENFKDISKLIVNFSDKITYLYGLNGAGKSTIRDALALLFDGKQAISLAHRSMMVKDKKALITCYIGDNKNEFELKRSMTKKDIYEIKLKSLSGSTAAFDMAVLYNTLFLYPEYFATLDPKQQAMMLLPDLDISQFDEKIKELKAQYTVYNRQYKKYLAFIDKEIDPPEVSISDKELEELNKKFTLLQNDWDANHRTAKDLMEFRVRDLIIDENMDDLEFIMRVRQEFQTAIDDIDNKVKKLDYDEYINTADRLKQISSTDDAKKEFNKYIDNVHEAASNFNSMFDNKIAQEEIMLSKEKYLSEQKLPFSEFHVNDQGELIYSHENKDKYFNQDFFSQAEIIKHSIAMLKNIKSQIKFLFISNASLLDPFTEEEIKSIATNDIQIVFEVAGDTIKKDNFILLKEGKVSKTDIESYKVKEKDPVEDKKETIPVQEAEEVPGIIQDTNNEEDEEDVEIDFEF